MKRIVTPLLLAILFAAGGAAFLIYSRTQEPFRGYSAAEQYVDKTGVWDELSCWGPVGVPPDPPPSSLRVRFQGRRELWQSLYETKARRSIRTSM